MNAQQAWQAALGQLQMEMPKASFDTWVCNAELVSHNEDTFTVGVENAYARDWLERRLTSTTTNMLTGLMSRPQDIRFIVSQKDYEILDNGGNGSHSEPAKDSGSSQSVPTNVSLNGRYSFDNFVVGSKNRLAHAASLAVAENPARSYNPLFLYGGVGLGKTHLMHAIGNMTAQRGLQVLYVSTEEFTNDFISSVRTHTPVAFRERYRQLDVLLIDDIQFIIGKEGTQEEFFHTFNTLHGQNKQIVITSDRSPKSMVTLEERMRSRFEWGLITDVQPPDLETRIAILRAKADSLGKDMPGEILEEIARHIQSNIRELEGALNRVLAYSDLIDKPLSTKLVATALADMLSRPNTIDPDQVVDAVANTFGVSIERLKGPDRSREVSLPRQVAMYLLRQDINISLPQIGKVFGGRDHTTVMHACSKVSDLIEQDDRLRRQIIRIREHLYGPSTIAV